MLKKLSLNLVPALLLATVSVQAAEKARPPAPSQDQDIVLQEVKPVSPFNLLNFRVGAIGVYQKGGSNYSVIAHWVPQYNITSKLYVGLDGSATVLSNQLNENYFVGGYQVMVGYWFTSQIGAELAGGAQTWTKSGRTYGLYSAAAFYKFDAKPLGFLDRIYARYSSYIQPGFYTSEVEAGIGLSF